MGEQMENIEKEFKGYNQYDDEKMNEALRRKPVIREAKGERARRKLIYAMNNANRTFKELGVKQITFLVNGYLCSKIH